MNTIPVQATLLPKKWNYIQHGDILYSDESIISLQNFEIGTYETKKPQHLYIISLRKTKVKLGDAVYDNGIVWAATPTDIYRFLHRIYAATDPYIQKYNVHPISAKDKEKYVFYQGKCSIEMEMADIGNDWISNYVPKLNNECVILHIEEEKDKKLNKFYVENPDMKELLSVFPDNKKSIQTVEELATDALRDYYCRGGYQLAFREGFVMGHRANPNKWTDDDMISLMSFLRYDGRIDSCSIDDLPKWLAEFKLSIGRS